MELEETKKKDLPSQERCHQQVKTQHSPNYEDMELDKLLQFLKKFSNASDFHKSKDEIRDIRDAFLIKYRTIETEKKQTFLSQKGNNEIDFSFRLPIKKEFDTVYTKYKTQLKSHYDDTQKQLKENYKKRLEIIEDLKQLITRDDHINTTYKHFLELQKRWREIGHIPKIHLEDTWKNYHHHVEIFYDFLNLNKALRDKDFKHNLEEKEKLIARAEALENEPDVVKAFKELQLLHKMWREEMGPVDKVHREDVWNQFVKASDVIRAKHDEMNQKMQIIHGDNLKKKVALLNEMELLLEESADTHNQWQQNIKKMNTVKEAFFAIEQVSKQDASDMWKRFRKLNGDFSHARKAFYDNQKAVFQKNIDAKQQLIEKVKAHLDVEDMDKVVNQVKQLQKDWKTAGQLPHKLSEKMWTEFRDCCDQFFKALHKRSDQSRVEALEDALEAKKALIEKLQTYKPSENQHIIDFVRNIVTEWSAVGNASPSDKSIEKTFDNLVETLLKSANVGDQVLDHIKYSTKIMKLSLKDLDREHIRIRKDISRLSSEKSQMETNLSFFNIAATNPLVKDIRSKIDKIKKMIEDLEYKKKKVENVLKKKNDNRDI